MKKKYLYRLALWVLLVLPIQKVQSQRGDFSFGLAPSYKANGYGISFSVNNYRSATDYVHLSITAVFSNEQPDATVEFPYEDYLLNLGYFTTVLSRPNRGLFMYFGGGASTGYEYINKGETDVVYGYQIPKSGMIYGGFASFEMDFYLTDSFSLFVPISGFYHLNSNLNNAVLLVGAGIRCYLK